jgi:DNA polymerase III epsilon subunit-like protein
MITDNRKGGNSMGKHTGRSFIVLDTETTGLLSRLHKSGTQRKEDSTHDEVLQLAIVNATEETLFYDSFKPAKQKSWPRAEKLHGITPRDVTNKAPFAERRAEIQNIIDTNPLIVAYNAEFDLLFLSSQGINLKKKRYICLMKEFARMHGSKKGHRQGYAWCRLEDCARHYGVANPQAHNAWADAQTTLRCYQLFAAESNYRIHEKEWPI